MPATRYDYVPAIEVHAPVRLSRLGKGEGACHSDDAPQRAALVVSYQRHCSNICIPTPCGRRFVRRFVAAGAAVRLLDRLTLRLIPTADFATSSRSIKKMSNVQLV